MSLKKMRGLNLEGNNNNGNGLSSRLMSNKLRDVKQTQSQNNPADLLKERDIVKRVMISDVHNPFDHDIQLELHNINPDGGKMKNHAHEFNHFDDDVDIIDEDVAKNTFSSNDKKSIVITLGANEHFSEPREVFVNDIKKENVTYHKRYPTYDSIESLSNNVHDDIDKDLVKILHTKKQPHPVVDFFQQKKEGRKI